MAETLDLGEGGTWSAQEFKKGEAVKKTALRDKSIDNEKYRAGWDRIFAKKEECNK